MPSDTEKPPEFAAERLMRLVRRYKQFARQLRGDDKVQAEKAVQGAREMVDEVLRTKREHERAA